jgi:hypothetical protein
MEPTQPPSYRGHALKLLPLEGGWDVRISDPAGHVADVELHGQLDQGPWRSPEEAIEAAQLAIDELLSEESSY